MSKQIYNQSGGWLGVIGAYLIGIVKEILEGIKEFMKWAFKLGLNNEDQWVWQFWDWKWGSFWVYIWWCIKVIIYLIICCFGGPIVILAGIIYLYSKLGTKLTESSNNNNNTKNNKNS
jgi:hypothetical protein